MNLWNGQRVLGRETGWFAPAFGGLRPEIEGGLFWGDANDPARSNATGYVENMQVRNNNQLVDAGVVSGSPEPIAIAVGATGTINVLNTDTLALRTTDGNNASRAYGVFSGNSPIISGGNHASQAIANGDGFTESIGIYGESRVEAYFVNTMGRGVSFGDGNAFGAGIQSSMGLYVDGGTHMAFSQSLGDGLSTARGISSTGDAMVNDSTTHASAVSHGAGFVSARGISTNANLFVNNGSHTTEGIATGSGSAYIRGVFGNNVFANGGSYSATTTLSGEEVIAQGIFGFNDVTATNVNTSGKSLSKAMVNSFNRVRGIEAFNGSAFVVGGTHTASAESQGNADTEAQGILAFSNPGQAINVTNAIMSGTAISTGSGQVFAAGVQAFSNTNATNSTTVAIGESSGSGDVFSSGISAFTGTAVVIGGSHQAQAKSGSGSATATGIQADNVANVGNGSVQTTVSATADSNPGTASATGVSALTGKVISTNITVSGDGTKNPCIGVSSDDGSCS